jgi:hypothetical protein
MPRANCAAASAAAEHDIASCPAPSDVAARVLTAIREDLTLRVHACRRQLAGKEHGWRGQADQIAEESQLAGIERRVQAGQKESAVETRQHSLFVFYRRRTICIATIGRVRYHVA